MMTSVSPRMISGSYTDAGSGNPEIIPPQVAVDSLACLNFWSLLCMCYLCQILIKYDQAVAHALVPYSVATRVLQIFFQEF